MIRIGRSRGDRSPRADDAGASAVEFALVLPVLLLLVFGIIEFGFVLSQMNEVRHAAREGARYAAVSGPDYVIGGGVGDNADVKAVVCDALNLPGVTSIDVSLTYVDADSSGSPERLEYGTVTVVVNTNSLSGVPFITSLLPTSLSNDAVFRLEQDGGWSGLANSACP